MNILINTLYKGDDDDNDNNNKARHISGNVIDTARVEYKIFKHLQLSDVLVQSKA